MIDALVEQVFDKIKDFRKDEGVQITRDGIREWAEQFGDDAEFMLCETDNILGKTYLTKEDAIALYRNYIKEHLKRHGYDDIVRYLQDVCYLRLQPEGKSQNVIVNMVEGIIRTDYGLEVKDYVDCSFAVRKVPKTRAFTTHSYRHVSSNAVTLEIKDKR